MRNEQLSALQVAALLVSASYGIGFLFGSGELAVKLGMAGCLYPWLTAVGMLLLASLAKRIWQLGVPLWDSFGRSYGEIVKRAVALLSLLWMAGVLAAQIQGAVTTLTLARVSPTLALPLVLTSILVAARLKAGLASKIFSLCLLASSAVLLIAVIDLGGTDTYLLALPRFITAVPNVGWPAVSTMAIAIVFLVLTGADYQQFVMAASSSRNAVLGCVIAGVVLMIVGALPAAAVIAAMDAGLLKHLTNGKEAIPIVLAHMSERLGRGAGTAMLLTLLAAALGSGAAIVRAMTDAALALSTRSTPRHRVAVSVGIVVMGAFVAMRGQAIVDTMVDLNIVYIASVAPLFALQLLNVNLAPRAALRSLMAGCTVSLTLYGAKWTGIVSGNVELTFLGIGMLASVAALGADLRAAPRAG